MPKKKYTQEQKETAIARLTLGHSPAKIARDLGVPDGTVRYWKSHLKKIQTKDGSLGYHLEERKNFVKRAWKIIEQSLEKTEKSLSNLPARMTPTDIKNLTIAMGIFYDKIFKALPQAKPGGEKPAPIDLSEVPTGKLRIIVAELEKVGINILEEVRKELPGSEEIEGEFREVESGEIQDKQEK